MKRTAKLKDLPDGTVRLTIRRGRRVIHRREYTSRNHAERIAKIRIS